MQTAQPAGNVPARVAGISEMTPEKLKETLLSYVPEGHRENKQAFLALVKSQVLGVDSRGQDRPIENLIFFLGVAKRTGLDPLARQIFAVFRWDSRLGAEKMVIQTSIDGFRLIAQRSKLYGGQDDAVFTPEDESKQFPTKATVTVYRINPKTGERMPVTASARWNEYAQKGKEGKLMGLWQSMPYNQLSKCAEALALRKAFPQELSGLYSEDEMAQSTNKLADLDLKKPTAIVARQEARKKQPVEATQAPQDNAGEAKDAEVEQDTTEAPQAPVNVKNEEIPIVEDGELRYESADKVDPIAARKQLKK